MKDEIQNKRFYFMDSIKVMRIKESCKYLLKIVSIVLLLVCTIPTKADAQSYSIFTSYTWDNWHNCNWKYYYSNDGWVYAYPSYAEPRNFYFRFKYSDLGLGELSRQVWKSVKQNNGWLEKYCTFEYYITDECQTMKSCLEKYSYPCAKAQAQSGKPSVLKSDNVKTNVNYTDDDEVRTLNFYFSDGSGFAIDVHWDYSGNKMTYTY